MASFGVNAFFAMIADYADFVAFDLWCYYLGRNFYAFYCRSANGGLVTVDYE